MQKSESLLPVEQVQGKILLLRGEKVLLDSELTALYGAFSPGYQVAGERG